MYIGMDKEFLELGDTGTIGITIYCYEINFSVTGKSRALEKPLIVMDQLWHLVRQVRNIIGQMKC